MCVWLIVKSLCFTTIDGYIMLHPRFAKWQNGGTKSTSDVCSDMFCRRLLTIPTPLLTCFCFFSGGTGDRYPWLSESWAWCLGIKMPQRVSIFFRKSLWRVVFTRRCVHHFRNCRYFSENMVPQNPTVIMFPRSG